MRISRMKTTVGLAVFALLIPVAASAKPVSSTVVNLTHTTGTVSVVHDGVTVSSLTVTRACEFSLNTESWTALEIVTSSVAEGRASNPTVIDLTANIEHVACDGEPETVREPFSLLLEDVARVQRSRSNSARILTTRVEAMVSLPGSTVPSWTGVSTETITR